MQGNRNPSQHGSQSPTSGPACWSGSPWKDLCLGLGFQEGEATEAPDLHSELPCVFPLKHFTANVSRRNIYVTRLFCLSVIGKRSGNPPGRPAQPEVGHLGPCKPPTWLGEAEWWWQGPPWRATAGPGGSPGLRPEAGEGWAGTLSHPHTSHTLGQGSLPNALRETSCKEAPQEGSLSWETGQHGGETGRHEAR